MQKEKLEMITNLFEGKDIRSVWDSEKEDYYFSVVDIIEVLTDSSIPKRYWADLKRKLVEEGSQVYENIVHLKLIASDGKFRMTDVLDTKNILRLIESIPSPKAEPFKLWLANLGCEEIDNIFDPSKGIDKMIDFYLAKGYSLEWIESRIKAIINRKKLTNEWDKSGIVNKSEYGILTNSIYKEWSGMTSSEYKDHKGIRKESLRDNMTDIEVILASLGEAATREIVKENKPVGLKENIKAAKLGGHAAKVAREDIEKNIGKSVISNKNNLNHKYVDNVKQLKNRVN